MTGVWTRESTGVVDTSMNVVELTVGNLDVVIAGPQPVSDLVRVALSAK